ncbi:MAG TPA: HEAT repeat domain-containing protein [Kofleriaceae bacterium]|nr:HEAT repeat domain-containing protein [Kofleriaceae bacterium]
MPRWLIVLVLGGCGRASAPVPRPTVQPDAAPAAIVASDAAAPDAPAISREVADAMHGLWSEHPGDVRAAAWWKQHADEVRPLLRALLEDTTDDGQGDAWAIRILGDLGDPADVDLLARVLATWPETARDAAGSALGAHASPAASAALIAATRADDVAIVGAATSGLGARKADPAARERLEQLLGHRDPTVRYRAVRAVHALGGSRPALRARVKLETDPEVKAALRDALAGK